jgi:hypothetical protein
MTEKEMLLHEIRTVRETINCDWPTSSRPYRSATTSALRLGLILSNVSKILRS